MFFPCYGDFELQEGWGHPAVGEPFPEPDHLPMGPQQSVSRERETGSKIRARRCFGTWISGEVSGWV